MANSQQPKVGVYIDPLTDFGFKKLFGTEPNKDLLIALLNSIFRGRKNIVDLTYNKNEHHGETKDEGAAIFDLTCTGDDGERFIIEVQRGKQGNFKQRAVFYTSRLISEQAPKGRRSEWAYDVKEVYFIALLEDFTLDARNDSRYLHDICLSERETGKVFYDGLGYIFIELVNFVKTEEEAETDLERWLYVLKNMNSMDKVSLYTRKPIFEKLFNVAEYANLTKEEKVMYDASLKQKWDNKAVLDYAVNEADLKARREERAKAEAEKLDIAREMKNDGISVEQIAKFTKLTAKEIEKL